VSKQRRSDLLNSSPLAQSGRLAESQKILSKVGSSRGLTGAMVVPIEMVVPNPRQIRQSYNEEALAELAEDIKARGILQPLVVRLTPDERYEVIAGERRLRAATLAGLNEVPVIVREMDDAAARFATLVENIQREDLSQEDEQKFYSELQNTHNLSIPDIARLVNKSQSYVKRRLYGELVSLQSPSVVVESETASPPTEVTVVVETPPLSRSAPTFNPATLGRASKVLKNALAFITSNELDAELRAEIEAQISELEAQLKDLRAKLGS
jgi:ParB/RepB/Spo0J family partition protein